MYFIVWGLGNIVHVYKKTNYDVFTLHVVA